MEGLLLLSLVIAIIAIVVLVYLYFSLKSQIPRQVEEAHVEWREKELYAIREEQFKLAQKDAMGQLQQWREQENALRKEQIESAQKDAMAQLQQWREQELELMRKQQLETARNEAAVSLEQWKVEYSSGIRQDAIQKSQAVTLGKVTEHFVPYLPDFTFNPKDARFLGSPVDFVVFDGLNDDEVTSVVFIEVKTGKSGLSGRERKVRDAVQSGKVQWLELRPQWESKQLVEEKAEFDVILKDSGAKKIEVFKVVCQLVPTLSQREAVQMVDGAPQTVLSAVSQETAIDAKAKLEAVGADVEVK